MVELLSDPSADIPPLYKELLLPDEIIAVVDDSPEIALMLRPYLMNKGLSVVSVSNAAEFLELLQNQTVALVLLDIDLPDRNGDELLDLIVPANPDLGIIMVTGTTDINVALACLRKGADDYLTKPVSIYLFYHLVESILKKRRLAISSRMFRMELEKTNSRMRFLHHLTLKMNTAFLNTVELRGILQAILVGITSKEGLRFNRAFLALYNRDHTLLEGTLATGPASRELAGELWQSLEYKGLHLDEILAAIKEKGVPEDVEVNRIVKAIRVNPQQTDHVLIAASMRQNPIQVKDGIAEQCTVPEDLLQILQESSFVVTPLFSPDRPLGVIIVDNFVTGNQITATEIQALEIFTSQASLAIEHSRLYEQMAEKIDALELATHELERSKDLLLAAERNAAIGDISGQLLHGIRNPLTSIGGTSRLLLRKYSSHDIAGFLEIIAKEAGKIEDIMEDLFTYVDDVKLGKEPIDLFPLVRRSVMIFYSAMKKAKINYHLDIEQVDSPMLMDETKIRQAFLHIIRNAIEAMPEGGDLRIGGRKKHDILTISISDSGTGIPENDLTEIRQPFYTTKTYGNGMGLAIVDRIIAAHNGIFEIQTNQTSLNGTTVTISLPTLIQ